ncbi:MAG: PstS family phosphate ABC transporter substrate-binding protein [Aggregatilineales bacterium]
MIRLFSHSIKVMVLAALLIMALTVIAQDDAAVANGSGIGLPLLESLVDASETELTLDYTVTGTAAGLDAFCSGEAAMTVTGRLITADEDANCRNNNVSYQELLLAHRMIAFVANPDDDISSCLTLPNLNDMLAPAAQIQDWSELDAELFPELSLALYIPEDGTLDALVLDNLIEGDGFRADVNGADVATILETVAGESGALGVVDYESAIADESIMVLDVDAGIGGGCAPAIADAVEADGAYPAALTLYLYVNTAFEAETLPFLFYLGNDNTELISENGFTAPGGLAQSTNLAVIQGEQEGPAFSQEEVSYEIPPGLAGELQVAGAASAFAYLNNTATQLTTQQTELVVNFQMDGEAAGVRRLCNGEVDMIISYGDLTDEQRESCDANNVDTVSFFMGAQAAVLLANEADDFAVCLTTDHLASIWGAASTDTVMNWSDVGESFPETPITLFGINQGTVTGDLLLTQADGTVLPVRLDTELDADPLYRAAATANVPGAITYMTWQEYQRVQANGQERIQLVAVDSGSGCETPTQTTISNGTYPLSRTAYLLVAEDAFVDANAQAYLWSLFQDAAFAGLQRSGFDGVSPSELPGIRNNLMDLYADADAAPRNPFVVPGVNLNVLNAPAAETTPELDAEATEEVDATEESDE